MTSFNPFFNFHYGYSDPLVRLPMRRKSVFYTDKLLSSSKVSSESYQELPPRLWYEIEDTLSGELFGRHESGERKDQEHSDELPVRIEDECDVKIWEISSYHESEPKSDTDDNTEDVSKSPSSLVEILHHSKLEEISDSNEVKLTELNEVKVTESNEVKLSEGLCNRFSELIYGGLNPMLSLANSKVREHKKLLNRFYRSFDQLFDIDEDYLLSGELEKDYLLPEELLSKPDLDLNKLEELPFEFRTSLIAVRSLIGKMNDFKQKCDGRLDAIWELIFLDIKRQSLADATYSFAEFQQELVKEIKEMNFLLKDFCRYADCCNRHIEEILMDVTLISEDFLV